jgi:hypothetical protein
MSTRGCLGVVKGGEFKVAQYCSSDSFPRGLGQDIIAFFKGTVEGNNIHDVSILSEKADKLSWIEDKRLKEINEIRKDYNNKEYHNFDYLFYGVAILNYIYNDGYLVVKQYDDTGHLYTHKEGNGVIEGLINSQDFFGDSVYCEWAYVIDLDNNTLEVYKGFNEENLTEKDRFYYLQDATTKYKPVKLVKKYDLSDLPNRMSI